MKSDLNLAVAATCAAILAGCGSSTSSNGNSSGGTLAGGTSSGGTSSGGTSSGGTSSGGTSSGGTSSGGTSSGGTSSGGTSSGQGGVGGSTGGAGGSTAGTGGSLGSAGTTASPSCDQITALAEAYKAANPGNGGKDWDINAKTDAQIAADPALQQLLSICGDWHVVRPVIPILAWEYGGTDHQWINPGASAVAYCVYIPVNPSTEHWSYDATADHVDADVFVKCPELNPCNNEVGANQVMNCLGDSTNIEILVDTASLNDGAAANLSLSNASTDLWLILPDNSKVHMYTGL